MPDSLRELVAGRVAGADPHARRALLVAAALSHPTVELVEQASSPHGLVAAEESGLLCVEGDRLVFAHPLYASAVYGAAASGRRRALHRRLAAQVADPEERVRHLALAAARPDERVARALEAAAAAARSRGAWESAGELLEQARALTPQTRPEAARARGVRAAEHHIYAGDRPRARALLEALLEGAPPGNTRSDALRLLAEVRYNEESFAGIAPLLEEACAHASDPALAVAIELDLTYVHCNHFGNAPAADAHADRALALAARAEDRTLHAEALAVRVMVDFLIGRGVDWAMIDRALALEGSDRAVPLSLRPSSIAACLKLWTGRHDEAREELTALRLAAIDSGDESDLAYLLTWLASLELWAEPSATDATSTRRPPTPRLPAASSTARGRSPSARWSRPTAATPTRPAPPRGGDRDLRALRGHRPLLWVSAALGLLELSLGDAAAAWAAPAPLAEAIGARPDRRAFDDVLRRRSRRSSVSASSTRRAPARELAGRGGPSTTACGRRPRAALREALLPRPAATWPRRTRRPSTRSPSTAAPCAVRARANAVRAGPGRRDGASRSAPPATRSTPRSRCSSRSERASGRSARATRRPPRPPPSDRPDRLRGGASPSSSRRASPTRRSRRRCS